MFQQLKSMKKQNPVDKYDPHGALLKEEVFEILKKLDIEIDYIKFAKPDSEDRMKRLLEIIYMGMFHHDVCRPYYSEELKKRGYPKN